MSKPEEFHLNGRDARAVGLMTDEGFLVRAGATVRKDIAPSGEARVTSARDRLKSEGVLVEDGDGLRLSRDYLFQSPSGAAAALLGRRANGWIDWKNADGETLSQVMRVSRDGQTPLLDDATRKRILDTHQRLREEGKLFSREQLDVAYSLFREKFGPAVLRGLDGEALLNFMHEHGNQDSLVYWLEFKNDEEFETSRFGSIAGGSALKFRIFKRKETGIWQAGAKKGNKPVDITTAEAIEYARSHRDQLLEGIKLLEALPGNASDEDYAELQDQMDELAPDVSRLAWGHKYFSLLFPDKLDDYHSPQWQRYILLKLLQLPPAGDGRYICAGRFIAASREAGLPIWDLTSSLNETCGNLHRYWRIGTRGSKSQVSFWEMMLERNCVAIGGQEFGELSWVEATKESRERLKKLVAASLPDRVPTSVGNIASQITQFIAEISEGDVVLAADGATILGIGSVTGGYRYDASVEFPHQREIDWIDVGEWKMPVNEGVRSTVRQIRRYPENILEVERRIQGGGPKPPPPSVISPGRGQRIRLQGVPRRIQSVLERKGQVILYGPPGTGKTYWAERTAIDLAGISAFGKLFDSLNDDEKRTVGGHGESSGFVRLCCFHPAYGYEDFLEGYRPQTVNGHISFELRDGVFKKLCKDAEQQPDHNFYLIVDEINRGDIPRIFGELLTTLEKDKRAKRIVLPVSQEVFTVPRNVFLIGTMNTADRSISLLDAALRRRFGFVEMMPDGTVLKDSSVAGIPLRAWFEALNTRIREHVGRDARNLQIGHSYLMQTGSPLKDLASLKRAIRDDIIPLLEEYCYEDYPTLARILGTQVVDSAGQRIRHELFDDGQDENLKQALLAPCPDISTTSEAVASEEAHQEAEENGDLDDEDDDGADEA